MSVLCKPVPGDFDGDGATDVAVTRLSDGSISWHVLKSGYFPGAASTYTQYEVVSLGGGNDTMAAEDFDGDGKTDHAVFRQTNGRWYILRSVEAGETYVLQVNSKRHSFSPSSRILTVIDDVADVDFTAQE